MNDLEQTAMERLRLASQMSQKLYKKPLVITYSGGKDSDCLLKLAENSGVEFEVLHSLTTADAPETVYHVRDTFKRLEEKGVKCSINTHKNADGTNTTMWNLIPKKLMPPTRLVRYCCAVLKEGGGKDRFIATGVRWDESAARKKNRGTLEVLHSDRKKSLILANDNDEDRQLFESCQLKGKRVVNPIVDWTTADVLDYCAEQKVDMNQLYECGFHRVGCIGCPMAGSSGRRMEFLRYPKFKAAYIRAFDKMLEERKRRGKFDGTMRMGATGVDVYHWWMEDGVLAGQEVLKGFGEEVESY